MSTAWSMTNTSWSLESHSVSDEPDNWDLMGDVSFIIGPLHKVYDGFLLGGGEVFLCESVKAP